MFIKDYEEHKQDGINIERATEEEPLADQRIRKESMKRKEIRGNRGTSSQQGELYRGFGGGDTTSTEEEASFADTDDGDSGPYEGLGTFDHLLQILWDDHKNVW